MNGANFTAVSSSDGKELFDPDIFLYQSHLSDYNFVCPVCKLVVQYATETPCGHLFCEGCIQTSVQQRQDCPVCRTEVEPDELHRVVSVQRMIDNQRVICIHSTQGCRWAGCRRDLSRHLFQCEVVLVRCPACFDTLFRRDVGTHAQSLCPSRTVQCVWCHVSLAAKHLEAHKLRCHCRPVSCRHCAIAIDEADLPHHVREVCPRVPVPCPYAIRGCPVKTERNQLEKHLHDPASLSAHLMMTERSLLSLETRLLYHDRHKDDLISKSLENLTFLQEQLTELVESMQLPSSEHKRQDHAIGEPDERKQASHATAKPHNTGRCRVDLPATRSKSASDDHKFLPDRHAQSRTQSV